MTNQIRNQSRSQGISSTSFIRDTFSLPLIRPDDESAAGVSEAFPEFQDLFTLLVGNSSGSGIIAAPRRRNSASTTPVITTTNLTNSFDRPQRRTHFGELPHLSDPLLAHAGKATASDLMSVRDHVPRDASISSLSCEEGVEIAIKLPMVDATGQLLSQDDSDFCNENYCKTVIAERREFMVLLCVALHKSGSPTHQSQKLCQRAGLALGVGGLYHFFSSIVFITFNSPDFNPEHSQSRHLDIPQGYDLAKVGRLTDLAMQVIDGDDFETCKGRLCHLLTHNYNYQWWIVVLAHAGAGAGATTCMFGGSVVDGLLAAAGGSMTALLLLIIPKIPSLAIVLEFIISFIISLLAIFASAIFPHKVCGWLVAFGSFVWLLPGLSLTIAVAELAHSQHLSGLAHLAKSIFATLQIAFGISLGSRLGNMATSELATCTHDLDPWIYTSLPWWNLIPSFLISAVSFAVLCGLTPRQYPPVVVACALEWYIPMALAHTFNGDVRVLVSAIILGITAGCYSHLGRHPLSMVGAAVLFLVPGAMAVRGFTNSMVGDTFGGFDVAIQALIVCLLISVGLLIGNAIVPNFDCLSDRCFGGRFKRRHESPL